MLRTADGLTCDTLSFLCRLLPFAGFEKFVAGPHGSRRVDKRAVELHRQKKELEVLIRERKARGDSDSDEEDEDDDDEEDEDGDYEEVGDGGDGEGGGGYGEDDGLDDDEMSNLTG